MAVNALIIGAGNIGSHLAVEAAKCGYECTLANSQGFFVPGIPHEYKPEFHVRGSLKELMGGFDSPFRVGPQKFDIVFLAMPSGGSSMDDGTFERDVIMHFVKKSIPVVTAGKSAVAYQYEQLVPYLPLIGRTATVGGGTRILSYLKGWLNQRKPFVVDLVVNGTMSFIMSEIWRGSSLATALDQAIRLKFAEPPTEGQLIDALAIFTGECEDVAKKLTIILNDIFGVYLGRFVVPSEMPFVPITRPALDLVTAPNARRKYVVRISTTDQPGLIFDKAGPGAIHTHIVGSTELDRTLVVSGGFCDIPRGTAMDLWVPDEGPGNGVRIDQGGTPNVMKGEGAGPFATVGSMLRDAYDLCPPN